MEDLLLQPNILKQSGKENNKDFKKIDIIKKHKIEENIFF